MKGYTRREIEAMPGIDWEHVPGGRSILDSSHVAIEAASAKPTRRRPAKGLNGENACELRYADRWLLTAKLDGLIASYRFIGKSRKTFGLTIIENGAKQTKYTPDYLVETNECIKIYIECKGAYFRKRECGAMTTAPVGGS